MALPEDVQAAWDKNALAWSKGIKTDPIRTLFNEPCFLNFVGNLNGKTVLDAACGDGALSGKIGAQRVVGIDISPKLIEIARQTSGGAEFHVGSVEKMTVFPAESFDVVICFMALMDVGDLSSAMNEFVRVLRPKGIMYVAIRHPCFLTPKFDVVKITQSKEQRLAVADYFSRAIHMAPCVTSPQLSIPRFPYTLSDYLNAVAAAGLSIIKTEEPRPPESACQTFPFLKFWRDHAAMFLYLSAAKAGS